MENIIGVKFTDGIRQYEILEKMVIKGIEFFKLQNYTDNRNNELMQLDQINNYISNQEKLTDRYNRNIEKEIEVKKQLQQEQEQEKEEQKQFNNSYGYCDNMTPLQKGKILKTLNKSVLWNDKLFAKKDFIFNVLTTYSDTIVEEYYNTNRYSSKKICLEYKKLADKIEYRIKFNGYIYDMSKTEYLFALWLKNTL